MLVLQFAIKLPVNKQLTSCIAKSANSYRHSKSSDMFADTYKM